MFLWIALCASAPAQSTLEQAVTLAREKRFSEASKLLEGVPEPAAVNQRIAFHRLKAAVASGLGDNGAAAQEMRAALAFAPGDPNLLMATAVAESQAGFLNDAIRHTEDAGNAASEQFRVGLALDWIKRQDFVPAVDLLKRSTALFANSAKLRTLLGIAYYAQGEIKDAENALEDAIKADPHLDSPYRCLAEITLQSSAAPRPEIVQSLCTWDIVVCSALKLRLARESGDAGAEQQALAVLKRAPEDSAIGRCELARGYEWTGQLGEARREMEACVKLDPLPQNHYRLALLYKKLGQADLARKELEVRSQILQQMSEQTALGLSALQTLAPPAK